MRVQERAYGEDVEERMTSPSAILEDVPSKLVEAVEKLGTSDVEVPVLTLEDGEALSDKVKQFMDIGEKSLSEDAKVSAESRGELSSFMSALTPNEQSAIFETVNNHLLEKSEDPESAFRLYQLQSAGKDLFEQPQLEYWVKFVNEFNNRKQSPHQTLIETLLNHYDYKTLMDAMDKKPVNKAALRVDAMDSNPDNEIALGVNALNSNPDDEVALGVDAMNSNPDDEIALGVNAMDRNPDNEIVLGVDAMDRNSDNKIALQVEKEIKELWLDEKYTPEFVFKLLQLYKTENSFFKSSSFFFWTKYGNFYNIKVGMDHLQSMLSVLKRNLPQYEPNLHGMKSELGRTTFLEKDIAMSVLKHWKETKKDAETVQEIVNRVKEDDGDLSIYYSAYIEAQKMYAEHPNAETIEPSTS